MEYFLNQSHLVEPTTDATSSASKVATSKCDHMSGPDPARKSHEYEQGRQSGFASYGPPQYGTSGSQRQDLTQLSANQPASRDHYVDGCQDSMTNHLEGGSSSSDLPPGYDAPGSKASAYYNISKGAMMENGIPGPTQRTASGRALPMLPGGQSNLGVAGHVPTSRQSSGSRPLPPRPPAISMNKSTGGGNHAASSAEPYSDGNDQHKPRKSLPLTPGASTHHEQLPPLQVESRNHYAPGYPTSPPPDSAFQNMFPPAFGAVPRMSPGTPGAPGFPPPVSPFPTGAMPGFPPSYMYGMPPMPAMDPTMYHTMPPPLAAAGMMGYPPYGVYPPGYMPPGWPLAQPPAMPGQDHLTQPQAYLPNQPVHHVPSYSETHTLRKPPPIAVPEWPVSGLDGNGSADGGVYEASALTPKPMLQNGSADGKPWKEHHRQNQGIPYQDDSSNPTPLAAQSTEGHGQAPPHDGHQKLKPLASIGNNTTTRKARGMEYLQSLGVTDSTPTPNTLSEEASVIEIWPPDSYDKFTSDSNTGSNATAEPMQSTTSLLHNTHITPQVGPESIFNHAQSQAHRESTVSIPNTIQSVGEGPSHPYERLARVSSVAPSWISQAREGGRPPARWVQNKLFLHQSHAEGRDPGEFDPESAADSYWDDDMDEDGMYRDEADESEEEENEMNFFMPSLESHVAVQLRDRVERNTHIKGGIAWPASFTGRDVVVRVNLGQSTTCG